MSAEFVGIELELRGEEGVMRDLEKIDRTINSLNGKKKLDLGMSQLKRELAAARGELEKFQRLRKQYLDAGGKGNAYVKEIEQSKYKVKDLNQAMREVTASAKTMGRTFQQEFNRISSAVTHIGSRMQSFGNALTRLTRPFTRLTTGLLYGAGYKALNMITEGFSGAFERYDTMKTYEKSLMALGLDATQKFAIGAGQAQTAIENLNDAVLGLPTGLDEIVAAQKVYAGATGEMVKSTKAAIAANNTFIASGMDARSQRFMQKYLVALSSGAELTTNQWQSMARIAPLAMRAVSEELGYASDEYAQFTKDVQSGTIAGQQFLDAFLKVGTEGKVQAAANVMKTTWAGLTANIQNATKRMGEAILKAADSAFEAYNGRNLVQNLLGFDAEGNEVGGGIKHWINNISEGIQEWVKANPDKIIDFFNTLKSIDWKGILKGIAEGFGEALKIMQGVAKLLGDKDLSSIGKTAVRLSMAGRVLTILGGMTKGSSHIIGGAVATIKTLRRAGKSGGLLGALGQLLGGKGTTIAQAGEEMAEAGTSMGKFSLGLSKWFKGWAQVAVAVGGSAFVGWASVKLFKSAVKNFGETVDLIKDIDWKTGKKALLAFGGFLAGFVTLSGIVGKFGMGVGVDVLFGEAIVGAITTMASAFFALDMNLIKKGIKNFADTIKILNSIPDIKDLGGLKDKITNAIEVFNEISELLNGKWIGPGMREGGVGNIGLGITWNLSNIAKAMSSLQSAAQNINKLATIKISSGAVGNIKKIIKVVGDISSEMWRLMGFGFGNIQSNITKIADALKQLRKVITHVNALGDMKVSQKGIGSIKSAIKSIASAFDGAAIGDLRAKITAFVASIQDAFTQFNKLNKTIVIKASVKLSSGFGTSVNKTVKQINDAKKSINSAWNGIPTTLTKTITFILKAKVIADSLNAGISKVKQIASQARGAAQGGTVYRTVGGTVYRAKGGDIPFRRKGTDTVPAMLTPGEYVQRKKAVNYFGIDFMRKVNSLDVRGAMHELMTKAGGMVSGNHGTTINNNYYNNQKVTQNINTNSPDFAFRSASRFVGAF